jgi:hypothetical protein
MTDAGRKKRETLAAAETLLEDNRAQAKLGTPLELTRQSLVTSSELDLIQAKRRDCFADGEIRLECGGAKPDLAGALGQCGT